MNIVLLIGIIVGLTMQNVVKKVYNDRISGGGVYAFNTLASLSALLFFVAFRGEKTVIDSGLVGYSVGFSVMYILFLVSSLLAVKYGSLAVTTLIISYSLIIPTLYGLIFLKESAGIVMYIGIVLLLLSLFLINMKQDDNGTGEKIRVTKKWAILAVLAFVGNGMCTVIQKQQQLAFDGAYKCEFMIIALLAVTVVMTACMFIKERKTMREHLKKGWLCAVLCGVMNGMVNLFVMILTGRMAASVMFPLISAIGIIPTVLIGVFYYKEKLSKRQAIGFLAGVLSVALLSI